MHYSEQQEAFLEWAENGTGSTVLEAVAGSGKTTMLIEAAKRMRGQVAILAYNKRITEEIKDKLKSNGMNWKKAQGGTVHSFGFSAYRKSFPSVRVEEYKVSGIIEKMFGPELHEHPLGSQVGLIAKLVSLAKQRAIGVTSIINDQSNWWDIVNHFDLFQEQDHFDMADDIIETAQKALILSNEMTNFIDFDDMVYLPLIHKCRFWQFDVVMVDEAQDTNPARRALVGAMVKRGGRVIAVGDRHQAIYGFTGADADALDLIAKDFSCTRMPLTVSYRCPKDVVSFAQKWVDHISAADAAPQGSVSSTTVDAFLKRNDLDGDAAVLCRLTKPLVELAFMLIRDRIPCRVEGRDVGEGLKKLMKRWKRVNTLDELETKMDVYLAHETTKLLAKKQESKLIVVEDTVATIQVIINRCREDGKENVSDAVAFVDELFSDNVNGVLVLSTIHKAKGREWNKVFWLDRANTCPSPWARQQWQVEQEINLCYVAATRSQDQLIELIPTSTAVH